MTLHRQFTLKLLAALLLGLAMRVSAQIALKLEAGKQRYLCFEPVHVLLTVSNLSGNTLIFNGETPATKGSISFRIDCSSGRNCKSIATLGNPADGLQLAPGESKTLDIIINQYYNFQREDTYNITAVLDHGRLPKKHLSFPVSIEVRDGIILESKSIGLPSENGDDSVIKTLKVSLLRFSDVEEDIYAMRVEDLNYVYATFRLGSYINGRPPQLEVDGNSLMHVLVQVRSRLFIYYIFNFKGRTVQLLQKRFYTSANGISPVLSKEAGYFRVENGIPAREGVDYVELKDNRVQTADSPSDSVD
ncbi:MAG: hypothetical protein IKS83_00020 [Victivallales bacterium]|nr:hypothetical protein [Victivallales bacterium]